MSVRFAPTPGLDETFLRERAVRNARLGLILWRIANGLIFVFFAFANLLMRTVQPSWPPPGVERLEVALPVIVSLVLLISGVFATRGHRAMRAGDVAGLRQNLYITMGLGLAFFAGILAVTARIPYSGPYSSIIVSMNVFHAAHVIIGMAILLYVTMRAGQGVYTAERHWTVEGAVIFWHFVDLMWVFFFVMIYVV